MSAKKYEDHELFAEPWGSMLWGVHGQILLDEDPRDTIENYLSDFTDDEMSAEITIYGHVYLKIEPEDVERLAADMAECLLERLDEDFGMPAEAGVDPPEREARLDMARAWVAAVADDFEVQRCVRVDGAEFVVDTEGW